MFATEPAKRHQGYANFLISDPPLKLVLIEGAPTDSGVDHLGVEVDSADELKAHHARMEAAGLGVGPVAEVVCCHAGQEKFWTQSPDGHGWEHYLVLDHTESFGDLSRSTPQGCCGRVDAG